MPKSDIEIARAATMESITDVGAKIGIPEDALLRHGHHMAKLDYGYINGLKKKRDGKLILVTAIKVFGPRWERKILPAKPRSTCRSTS